MTEELIDLNPQKIEYEFEASSSYDEAEEEEEEEVQKIEMESDSESESEYIVERPENNTKYYITVFIMIALLGTIGYQNLLPNPETNIMYPLLLSKHDTTSKTYHHDAAVKNRIESQLKLHLIANPQYGILCMHHLDVPILYIKICVMYAHPVGQFITMLNPKIIGGSTEKSLYDEKSVACANVSVNERQKRAMVQWDSDEGPIYALFDEMESVMLQMIIDEQNGLIKC